MLNKLSIFAFFIVCCCCSERKVQSTLPRFGYANEKAEPLQTYPELDSLEIVPLETKPGAFLGIIESIEVFDSVIFIKDNFSFHLFNRNGKFIAQVGRRGQGPDEYIGVNAFFIDKAHNEIVLMDEIKSAFLRYDLEGNFVSSKHVPSEAIKASVQAILYGDSSLLINHFINFEANMAFTVLNGQEYKSYLSYNPITVNRYMYSLSKRQMAQINNSIDFIMPICDTIFSFSNGIFSPKYVVDLPFPLPPRNKFKTDTEHNFPRLVREYSKQGFFSGFTSLFETDNKLLMNYLQDGLIMGYFLGDKNSLSGNYCLNVTKNPVSSVPFFQVIGASKDAFIGVSDAQTLLSLKNNVASADDHPFLSIFRNVIDSLKYDDNPVLFFYYLK